MGRTNTILWRRGKETCFYKHYKFLRISGLRDDVLSGLKVDRLKKVGRGPEKRLRTSAAAQPTSQSY